MEIHRGPVDAHEIRTLLSREIGITLQQLADAGHYQETGPRLVPELEDGILQRFHGDDSLHAV
jgi:hypothetical protein